MGSTSTIRLSKLIDLRAPMSSINLEFIVLDRGVTSIIRRQEGQTVKDVPSCFVTIADSTAAVKFQAIGQDEVDVLQPSEILRLTGGVFSMEKSGALLRCGRKGLLERIGSFDMVFTEEPNLSTIPWTFDPATQLYSPSLLNPAKPSQAHRRS